MSAERAGDGLDSTAKQGGKLIHKEEEGGGTSVLAFEGSDIQDSRCGCALACLLLACCFAITVDLFVRSPAASVCIHAGVCVCVDVCLASELLLPQ